MRHKTAPWKKLLFKTGVWLISEIVLNAVGTDTLADYGEFVFDMERLLDATSYTPVAVCHFQSSDARDQVTPSTHSEADFRFAWKVCQEG